MNQWQCSWIGEKISIEISMVSTVTTNGKFSPFVLSIDGILGREALVVIAQLSRTMTEKREKPILHLRGWINGKIRITVARS